MSHGIFGITNIIPNKPGWWKVSRVLDNPIHYRLVEEKNGRLGWWIWDCGKAIWVDDVEVENHGYRFKCWTGEYLRYLKTNENTKNDIYLRSLFKERGSLALIFEEKFPSVVPIFQLLGKL